MVNLNDGDNRYWNADKATEFYTSLESIENRCPGLETAGVKFDRLQAHTPMDMNNGAGCVLILTDGALENGVPTDKISSGIYHGPSYMDRDNYGSNNGNIGSLSDDKIAHMQNMKRNGDDNDRFFIMQWQATPDIISSLRHGLEDAGLFDLNPVLYRDAINSMSPESWPTVIQQDYVGYIHLNEGRFPDDLSAELRTLCIGLNWFMINQNTAVNAGGRSMQEKTGRFSRNTSTVIIFANDTRISNSPPGFHLGRVGVLKAGTVFHNGTILTEDLMNPCLNFGD
ncbi:hypothetical protein QBC38DRAFT_458350 [Podospora fimiseda]|uniref:Uncharacterized protein n=1 Tax=Podospora fimiseda TaxID=252190 RepID=A0AAN7GU08_9PEZI|nr:hypothetical protein QBC38DRAFT_458350 [Podospora fimiseda]